MGLLWKRLQRDCNIVVITIEAIDKLYCTERKNLFNYARKYCDDFDTCWDVVHDIFMDILHRRDKLSDKNLKAYAQRAIKHRFLNLNGYDNE